MPRKLILDGIVQGVFCRNYCSKYARRLGLKGSASNMRDGTVRVILLTDDDEIVKEYILQLRNNPMSITFYGKIESIFVSQYDGPAYGDYIF